MVRIVELRNLKEWQGRMSWDQYLKSWALPEMRKINFSARLLYYSVLYLHDLRVFPVQHGLMSRYRKMIERCYCHTKTKDVLLRPWKSRFDYPTVELSQLPWFSMDKLGKQDSYQIAYTEKLDEVGTLADSSRRPPQIGETCQVSWCGLPQFPLEWTEPNANCAIHASSCPGQR